MDQNFKEEYRELKNKALLQLNSYFFEHLEEMACSFRESLKEACEQIAMMQKNSCWAIEYLEFTLLRTRILEHDYRAPIIAYGTNWYADENQTQAGMIQTEAVFSFFEAFIHETERLVKKYRSKLPEQILSECMCKSAEAFWRYVTIALQQAVMGFEPGEMKITDEFRIRSCEYMGYGEVLRRYTPNLTQKELKKWFDKKEKEAYQFRDFRGRDFSGWDLSGMDFTGCDFRGCSFTGASLEKTDLTGAWFSESLMRDADLRGAWVPGVRFDRTDLTGASLQGAYCVCKINSTLWMRTDNVRPSFAGAILKNVDFTFSAMEGADFTGAALDGAAFNEIHRKYYSLDSRQASQSMFEEEAEEEDWEGWDSMEEE